MNKQSEDIFIVRIKGTFPNQIDIDSVKDKIILSQEFWEHFTSTFPAATAFLFNQPRSGNSSVELNDSSCVGIVVYFSNRLPIINHLPKDLSKEQSDSYFKSSGYFVIPKDSLTSEAEVDNIDESDWKEASPQVQREYQLFRNMLDDFDNDFAVIVKKQVVENIIQGN